jgi:ABC-type branched-subunit amino acid transport system ATPase component
VTNSGLFPSAHSTAAVAHEASTMVELVDVAKSFGAFRAVDGVSLSFAAGETVGVVGPNGAGKTTLFGLISGAHPVTSGRVWLKGRDVTGLSTLRRARRGVSRTFQTARIFPALTVEQHLMLALPDASGRRLGWPRSRLALSGDTRSLIAAAAEEYGLAGLLGAQAASLPQAQRKILDLAIALAGKPDVLLLDEPTAGVAIEDVAAVEALTARLRQRHPEATVIMSSHDADLIARQCSRIVVLVRGKVLADGPTDKVVADPRVRAAYFGDVVHV